MLTNAQLVTLKADILANPDLNSQPLSNLGSIAIADLYNAQSDTKVWRTEVPVALIQDAIDWTKYTPQDAIPAVDPATGNGDIHRFVARGDLIQIKQNNLFTLIVGREFIDASKALTRSGLRDATTLLPAGASGANVSASGIGGADILNAMTRMATRAEKLFAGAPAVTGPVTAKLLVFEGFVTGDEVQLAREMV